MKYQQEWWGGENSKRSRLIKKQKEVLAIFCMKEWGGVRSRTKEATDIVFMASLRFLPDGFPEDK